MRHLLALGLAAAVAAAGCQTVPCVIGRDQLEQVRQLPQAARPEAVVQGFAAGRRVRIRYRALRLDDATLDRILAQDFKLLRIEATRTAPAEIVGLVLLGAGLTFVGIGAAVLHGTGDRGYLGAGTGLVLSGLGGAQVLIGTIATVVGALNPLVEPVSRSEAARARPAATARGAGLVLRF